MNMRRDQWSRELVHLPVGHAKVIAWEPVFRHASELWEIGTFRVASNQRDLDGTLDRLCALRHVTEVTQ
jgi:hypothetical protein